MLFLFQGHPLMHMWLACFGVRVQRDIVGHCKRGHSCTWCTGDGCPVSLWLCLWVLSFCSSHSGKNSPPLWLRFRSVQEMCFPCSSQGHLAILNKNSMISQDWNLFSGSHGCLILSFWFFRFQDRFREQPASYRPPSFWCGGPGGKSGHAVLQGGGKSWAHYPVAQKWPTSWHGQDGCAFTAYRFTRRKFVLLQRRPWPKESVPWSSVRLRGSKQRWGGD